MFSTVSPFNAYEMQQELLAYWDEIGAFEHSVALHQGREKIFYDGPPFPTGAPHHGTVLVSILKDALARYFTMRGYAVPRRWGWDCHGLPIETQAEKLCGVSGKREIEQRVGVAAFNDACRSIVGNYNESWRAYIREIGRWVDYDNAYKTMDLPYMESVLWAFHACYEKGLIYRDYRVTPYCTRCETSLSISDTRESDATRPRQDPSVVVRFRLEMELAGKPVYALAWTTTPWTLPSNLALGVAADAPYVLVYMGEAMYLLGKEALTRYPGIFGASPAIIEERPGAALVGVRYQPIYPYFADRDAFRVLAIDFVESGEGTGIVHLAPAFGEDDYWACKAAGIAAVCPVDEQGRFTGKVIDYAGRHVLEANREIMRELQARGVLLDRRTIEHNYPHCWRCRTPLIYRAMDAWYFSIEQLKPTLLEQNAGINWVPDTVRDGRFGQWLQNARDWNLSRNRFWGTPIPVWVCDGCGERQVFGSIQAIEKRWGQPITDLHKEILDKVTFSCPCGGTFRRVPEVLDGWFESAAMPYAQVHYPFENREWFQEHFPADFIVEYTGQIRCWFYYLHVLATALFGSPAFRNCLVHGTILAKDGKKISKSKRNYTDPMLLMRTHGSDALRLYLLQSSAAVMGDLLFDDDGVKAMVQQVLLPLWNAHAFFVTYANPDGWTPAPVEASADMLDRWILARLYDIEQRITRSLDAYRIDEYVALITEFVDDLTNWYIRRSRRRFWANEMDTAKRQAYQTLHTVLTHVARLLAPAAPFISEAIYRNLTGKDSVHLADWPALPASYRDNAAIEAMVVVRKIVRLGLSIRVRERRKVRQPLARLECALPMALPSDCLALIADELNVKEVAVVQDAGHLAVLRYLPDLKRLGPLLGKDMPAVAGAIRAGSFTECDGLLHISVDGREWAIEREMVFTRFEGKEGRAIAEEDGIVVALDIAVTDALRREGIARELVRVIQDLRKQAGYAVTDRILLNITGPVPEEWRSYIAEETLAEYSVFDATCSRRTLDIDGERVEIGILRSESIDKTLTSDL